MAHRDSSHRRPLLDERCARHQFEAAVDRCRQCGFAFCGECVVYAFGEHQPPYCIPCALAASGVRSGAARQPALPKKELRRREKEARRAAKEAEEVAATQAAQPQIDWSLPVVGNGTAPPPVNGNGHGPASGSDDGHEPPAPADHGDSGAAREVSHPPATFPTFDDELATPRSQPPTAPPKAPGKTGLFGRRKSKAVPF